jgi:hypothetical protein
MPTTVTIPYPLDSDPSGVVLYTDLSNIPQAGNTYSLKQNGNPVSDPFTYITDYAIDMGFLTTDASYLTYYNAYSSQITADNVPIVVHSGPNLVFNGAMTTDTSCNIYAICEFVYNITVNVLDYTDFYTGISYYSQQTGDTGTDPGTDPKFPRQLALVKVDPFYGTLQYLLNVTSQTDYNGLTSFFLDPTRTYLYYLVDGGATQQTTHIKKIAISDGTQYPVYDQPNGIQVTPFGMAMDSVGNLYVAENYGRILKVDPSTGTAVVYATFEYDISQQPNYPTDIRYGKPQAITFDSSDNLYVTDNGTSIDGVSLKCIIKIPSNNSDGTNYKPATTAGNYDAIPGLIGTSIFDTFSIQVDDLNHLYVQYNGRVYNVDLASPSLSVFYENFSLKTRGPNNNILCSSTTSTNIQRIAATTYTFTHAYVSDYSGQNYVDLSLNDGTADLAGVAVRVYNQLLSSDSSLSVFTLDSTDVLTPGSSINVSYTTTSVTVVATPTDLNASVNISGDTGFQAGNIYTVTVVVTAQDGVTQTTYTADVFVDSEPFVPSSDATLSTWTINGTDVLNGGTVDPLAYGTSSLTMETIPNHPSAIIASITNGPYGVTIDSITNSTVYLGYGVNNIVVTVQAEDNSTQNYDYTVYVNGNNDATLQAFTINGIDVLTPNSVVNVSYNVTSVTVVATPTDSNASASISGDTGLHAGANTVTITVVAEDLTTTQTYTATVQVAQNIVCFREGSKILCLVEGRETYVPIQSIRKGALVKTHLHGYVPVESIGYSKIYNPGDALRSKNRLYKLKPARYPELMEPLYLTGCHSILVSKLSETEKEDAIDLLGRVFITDNKYRLMACIDERAKPYEKEGLYTIWHFALEHVDYYKNYGVYANGLLVESSSRRMMQEYSGMKLI